MGFKIVSRYQRIKCVYFKTLNVVLIFWITTKLTLKTQRQQQKISASVSVSYKSKELGWLTYLSNFLSPTDQKVGGGQIFFLAPLAKLSPTFKTVAPPLVLFRWSVESSMHQCTHQYDASVKSTGNQRSQTKFHRDNSVHGGVITISGLKKQAYAILEFFF